MTVSILGCGWFGLALGKHLLKTGITVQGSTTSADKLQALEAVGILPYLIDLSPESEQLNRDFFNCDVLIIAIPPKARSGQGQDYVTKLGKAVAGINGGSVQKVILISSTGVYADLNKIVTELDEPAPNTEAGKILFAAEELSRNQTAFKTTVIRFAGLVGPERDPGRFFAGKQNVPNGQAPINLIHLDDCIGVTEAIIEKDKFGYTFNACTPHHPTRAEFYTKAAAKSGYDVPGFLPELNEWKVIESVNVKPLLGYAFKITDWNDWLA
ncbi:SDR family oxidoreductase [Mucilaginibacter pallidiroseus]|uniref:SDR family oxidoreductase n=1 Tax=Mucilaginibacter pallidiroseus TaxID=2599295 RepID=A0A563UCC6_9SPHI|nr:SDR family oxidoreductase [Mucilaginibacter pallidiroseus]TWR28976.1 SDR family oxidoreductase [Mucilaginibacter pallidiroseus]